MCHTPPIARAVERRIAQRSTAGIPARPGGEIGLWTAIRNNVGTATMSSTDDDRIAYLAGEDDKSLTAQERADLDQLRAVLRSSAAWVEPDPRLEDRVVRVVAAESSHDGSSLPSA